MRTTWQVLFGQFAAIYFVAAVCSAQGLVSQQTTSDAGKLEFDVASVRQNKSNVKSTSNFSLDSGNVYSGVSQDDVQTPEGGYFSATNMPLMRYIVFAYRLNGTQELALRFKFFTGLSSNVPGWINTERFDIKARADGHPTKDQMRMMMRALLEERFKLVVHIESREVPVFALVLANAGKKETRLKEHPADDSCFVPTTDAPAALVESGPTPGLPAVCGVLAHLPPSEPGRNKFGGRGVSFDLLATSLPTQTGMATVSRPVVDETGLKGLYDFSLEWVPEIDGVSTGSGPTFAAALKEQLELKLEPKKGQVEILVVDRVEMPSEN